jgi:hypothetical protein
MLNPGAELASLDFANLIGGPLNAVITAQSMAARSTADFIKSVGFYPEGQTDPDGNDIGNQPVYVDFKYPKEIQPFQPAQNPQVISAPVTTAGAGYAPNQVANVTFTTGASGEVTAAGTVTADASGNIPIGTNISITNPGSYPTTTTVAATVEAPPAGTGAVTAVISTVNLSAAVPASPAVFQEMKFSVPILTMLPIPFIKVDILTIDFNAKITSIETQSQSSDLSVGVNLEVKQRWPGGSAKLNASVAYKKSTSSGSSVERTYSMAIHVQASQDEMPAGMEKLLGILENAMISTPGGLISVN